MRYNNGFLCDKESKEILKNLIENKWFSSCTIVYDEYNNNNPKARIDFLFTAITQTNKERKYAIELKERKGYNHNAYKDWILETDKYKPLKLLEIESGYTSAYMNIFKDDVYALWLIKSIDEETIPSTLLAPKQTQGDETKIKKDCINLDFNNAILTGYTYE